ncbi:bacillithiol system redox-active protein YtxJ [Adhaeribacter rhizoryzae]|uniref:Bacillithiol system redox-active protein YtxJ n=1 Tax=Adhaeribacter rhizoryzae TaxID=2607907 RepID=A0A5M6DDZ2_9BACT|nr:bacillithiol system redox-active protein YtxJ [Adhaeribacter rhizoryzae]KAA5545708.1 bacillithiol system redox-active protein YtxJ [Adhaeribacter rhizoryzae]
MVNWNALTQQNQIQEIITESKETPVIIFKHSTTCAISATAKNRLERQWADAGIKGVKTYYLDLLAHRPVSNQVAQVFGVEHQSPQLLVIKNGVCQYDASHLGINLNEVKKNIA